MKKRPYKRADVIIVTQMPMDITIEERERIIKEINPHKVNMFCFLQPLSMEFLTTLLIMLQEL
jgi:hypothetical protein